MKRSGLKRTPFKRGKKGLNRVSKRRAKEEREYNALRQDFMRGKLHCARCQLRRPLEVHHMAGRDGDRFLDVLTWAAVCRDCHEWIHANPAAARAQGFLSADFGVRK